MLAIGGAGYWAMTRSSGPALDPSGEDVGGAEGPGGADAPPVATDSLPVDPSQLAGEPSTDPSEDADAQTGDPAPDETVAEAEGSEEETAPPQEEVAPPQEQEPEETRPTPPVSQPPAQDPEPIPTPVPGAVALEIPQTSMQYAATQRATARVFSTAGAPMSSGAYALSWRSSEPAVLAVDGNGTVSAVGPGSAWLVASADGIRDSVEIDVTVDVRIEEGDFALEEGASRTLSVAVTGARGATLDAAPTWRSTDATVARVDESTGDVTAVAPGSARITASVAGFEGAVTVTVEGATPGPPTTEVVRGEVDAYVATLSGGDTNAVNALWGGGSEDLRQELLELMDENAFSARLETMGDPSLQGDVVRVTFRVVAEYRNFAGAGRDETVDFQAELRASDGAWNLVSATATAIGG